MKRFSILPAVVFSLAVNAQGYPSILVCQLHGGSAGT